MDQLLKELSLIGGVAAVTLISYLVMRRSGASGAANANRLLSGLLGAFLLLGGVAKFFLPFTDMFAQQIALSQLPFPALSAFAGQAGEITAGIILLGYFIGWQRLRGPISDLIFALTTLLVVIIMLVAVYVHLHPDVPAEVLPFQSKPPVLTVIIMALAILNGWLRRKARLS
ncbi:hypothetical protein [Sulfitobacter sp. R18_1]|uniref:hypothetical protein n=1 Tax=Sulfitobacter sp. R18_1 TaxID=2821104 RepID=UPI001ADA5F82|nr:hypothetical protein [Sulfitobacter sp. R18_1]MBO9432431.1 hypothetical protein [Sulfitobacter sp. R18_1]